MGLARLEKTNMLARHASQPPRADTPFPQCGVQQFVQSASKATRYQQQPSSIWLLSSTRSTEIAFGQRRRGDTSHCQSLGWP